MITFRLQGPETGISVLSVEDVAQGKMDFILCVLLPIHVGIGRDGQKLTCTMQQLELDTSLRSRPKGGLDRERERELRMYAEQELKSELRMVQVNDKFTK